MSLAKLSSLQHDGLMAKISPFNLYEWLLQVSVTFLFCVIMFYYNRKYFSYYNMAWQFSKQGKLLLNNMALWLLLALAGGGISRIFFYHSFLRFNGYFLRLLFSTVLILIELKVLATVFLAQQKEKENNQLRLTNMSKELELLKGQLNPHFFFNALSSLSGIVRENPQKAQAYISHLSKIFRYSLSTVEIGLVLLKEELDELYSYGELMKMRYEEGFRMEVNVDAEDYLRQLPHMSLQPLIENVLKHNVVTAAAPVVIFIYVAGDVLEIKNSLQPRPYPEPGAGIGLANLNERFRILMNKEISVIRTNDSFTVKLPLK
jgi:two-component system, LytTR family, sensor kinase